VVRAAFTLVLRLHALGAVAILVLAATPAARAQELSDSIEIGPWLLAPSFSTGYESDSNIFLKDEKSETSDRVTSYSGELTAILPFRNSSLELEYSANKDRFSENEFPRDTTDVMGFDLELNLKSGDRLSFRDVYRRDFARSEEIDTGGELTFNGEPYNLNRWEVELARTDPQRQGYVIRVRRQDFIYEGEQDVGFFEYHGFDNSFEYRQPIPNRRSWVVRYDTRRFNHYEPQPAGELGVPYRKEKTDAVSFGLRGVLRGRDQPYRIHLGFGRFRYDSVEESEFEGIVGSAAMRLRFGGATSLNLEVVRRPLPSNFVTYYINNGIRADLEREWVRFEAGTEFEFTKNNYADDLSNLGNVASDCDGRRKDETYQAEVYVGWKAHERLRFEMSSFYKTRSSTCDASAYDSAGFETGLTIGWF